LMALERDNQWLSVPFNAFQRRYTPFNALDSRGRWLCPRLFEAFKALFGAKHGRKSGETALTGNSLCSAPQHAIGAAFLRPIFFFAMKGKCSYIGEKPFQDLQVPIKINKYRLADVVPMLDVSEATVRRMIDDLGIEPERIPAGKTTRPVYSIDQVLQLAKAKRHRGRAKFKRPLVIAVYVPKGGVGKSTLSNEFAAELSLQGYNVLAIDLDDQASLTVMNGYQPDEVPDAAKPNDWLVRYTFLNALYPAGGEKSTIPLSEIIVKPYGEHGPKLVPADITLGELGYRLANQPNREKLLRNWLSQHADSDLKDVDIVLIDNAPSTSVVSRASIVAADLLLIPVRLDALTVKSLSFLANELNMLQESQLPIPQVIAVPNFFKANNNRSARVMAALQRSFGDEVPIAPHIGESERFPRSLMYDVGREGEEVLPVTFEGRTRAFERQHDEIRNVCKFVVNVAEETFARGETASLFDEAREDKRA
jgi:chromosome partitioning protein